MPKLKDKSIKYRILLVLLEGNKRFSDLLSDIKRATLSNELQELERYRLIKRTVDNKIRPPRVTYSITDRGKELLSTKASSIIQEMEGRLILLKRVVVPTEAKDSGVEDPSVKAMVDGIIGTALDRTEKHE